MTKSQFDEYLEGTPDEEVKLDLNVVKLNIPSFASDKLCDMIICDRYFGYNKDVAIFCMEELANRRANGDSFDFETYIKESIAKLPKLDFSMPDFNNILKSIKK